ncbi:MAG TPA: ABC transporter ATP-binding protein [Polyangiales bacterium]|nr:ABC transporter ATP-binding protein [Polyangiales bacterium]
MAIVETRGLRKVFANAETAAVNGIDLQTKEGEFLVFLGPSGSGKSTLLRMIAGLEAPSAGEILIGGQVVNAQSPRERRIAMVFQSYALYPHLSVYENIAFPLKAQGVPRAQHADKVKWAAGLLGLERLFARKPRELSGGERQRVALARAIVREPAVFLLDEPLSNLDAKLRLSAREELEHFHRRIGTTTIYVTHDQVEAMAMGDRIVVLHQGTVRQIGTPREVYDEPADAFVASFLGSPPMNLFEDGEFLVGFRPEHLQPTAAANPGALSFALRVQNLEYLGSEWILYAKIEEGRFAQREVIARLPAGASGYGVGQSHDFSVATEHLHFFDKAKQTRLAARPAWP